MMRCITCFVIFALSIFFASGLSSGNSGLDNNPLVKINILSKHVRLVREEKLDEIEITLPDNSVIIDENNNEQHCRIISFSYYNNKFQASIDSITNNNPFKYNIINENSESVFKIRIGKEIRQYPATLQINFSSKDLEFYVWDKLNQYAVDSACAEIESSFWKEQEALLALAHVIRARYYYAKRSPQHKDFDFCDLTHCQVYRGRLNSRLIFDDSWYIDDSKLKQDLFFHSNCGGHTLGTEVFAAEYNSESAKKSGVRDWLYHTGTQLCLDSSWERSISADEMNKILADKPVPDKSTGNKSQQYNLTYLNIDYSNSREQFIIYQNQAIIEMFAPETLRLKINREKGWNFIKSNNYAVVEELAGNNKIFRFKGNGLGHGVGLCQYGAITLSRIGYNRYEILEHYNKDIKFYKNNKNEDSPPYLSFCIFNLSDGTIRKISSKSFLNRKAPPGSVFKILVSLYLAKERPDLFNDYNYNCTGKENNPVMPDHCWTQKGHGKININEAIPNSCNLYFASLYDKIPQQKFMSFLKLLCNSLGLMPDIPQILNDREWANMLAGLDYRILFSLNDYIKIIRFLKPDIYTEKDNFLNSIPAALRDIIFYSLKKSFISGTASGSIKPYGAYYNFSHYTSKLEKANEVFAAADLWGKTSTTIDGTNLPVSYGMFIGGMDNTGIIVLLRKGNGHLAAKWAQVLLSGEVW
jgi:SpoIID/LytB domain protein